MGSVRRGSAGVGSHAVVSCPAWMLELISSRQLEQSTPLTAGPALQITALHLSCVLHILYYIKSYGVVIWGGWKDGKP